MVLIIGFWSEMSVFGLNCQSHHSDKDNFWLEARTTMVPISNWTRTSRRRQWRLLFGCWRLPCKAVLGLLRSKKQHFKVLRAQWAIPKEKDVVDRGENGILYFYLHGGPSGRLLGSAKALLDGDQAHNVL